MTGMRFDHQLMPQGQRGGIQAFPFSGILNGLAVSNPVVDAEGNGFTVSVSPGSVKLDGVTCVLANSLVGLLLPGPVGVDLATATANVEVFLNPVRHIPALLAEPEDAVIGDKYIRVTDQIDYYQAYEFYEFSVAGWVTFDPSTEPPGYGHNNLPLNAVVSIIDTASSNNRSFAIANEKIVYHRHNAPPYVYRSGYAYLRMPAGVKIATIRFENGAASVLAGPADIDKIIQ